MSSTFSGRLPNGKEASSTEQYINTWRSFTSGICSRLGGHCRCIAFDPGLVVVFDDGHTEDISQYLAELIAKGNFNAQTCSETMSMVC